MLRVISRAAALLSAVVVASASAAADDRDSCNNIGEETIAACTRLLQRNPNDWTAYSNRGVAYNNKGQYEHAIADISQAIKLNPNIAVLYTGRGSIYGAKGDHDHAIGDYSQAIRLDPKSIDGYIGRGLAYAGSAQALRVIVLDACRNNPFKERMRATVASRGSLSRGLAPPPETEPGTLVVYSAKEGEVAADDVDGANSPFARAFVAELKVPGREVRRMFDYVRDDVIEATNKRQQPFTYGSLPGRKDFYFMAGK